MNTKVRNRVRGIWLGWLIAVGFVVLNVMEGKDWAHIAGGVTVVLIWAIIAYFTVGLPFKRKED
jgi:membrane protein YdbS with pleckstrin-like domain